MILIPKEYKLFNNFLKPKKMKNFPQQYEQLHQLMGELGGHIPKTMSAFTNLHINKSII